MNKACSLLIEQDFGKNRQAGHGRRFMRPEAAMLYIVRENLFNVAEILFSVHVHIQLWPKETAF